MPSTTINYTASEGQRIAAAVGLIKNLKDVNGDPRSATAQECKEFIIERLRQFVLDQERQQAAQAITDIPLDPT